MANLSTQTKYINIVVRKKNLVIKPGTQFHDDLLKWCNSNCELYAFIYHLNDVNKDGLSEDSHLHLVCTLNKRKRISSVLSSFCTSLSLTTLGVMIDKCDSVEGSLQYLLHKNDTNKTPHYFNEIYHNYIDDELKTILESDNDGNITPQRLYDIVYNAKSNFDIIKVIGINKYHYLRNVIKDIKEDIDIKKGINKKKQYEVFKDIN